MVMAIFFYDAPLLAFQLVPAVTAMCVVGGGFFSWPAVERQSACWTAKSSRSPPGRCGQACPWWSSSGSCSRSCTCRRRWAPHGRRPVIEGVLRRVNR